VEPFCSVKDFFPVEVICCCCVDRRTCTVIDNFGRSLGSTFFKVKCFGIEDFWGNYWEFVDGLCTDGSWNVLTCQCAANFDTDGTDYDNNGNGGVTADIGNYMSRPQGGSNAGFTAQTVAGSDSTYHCDYASLCDSCLAIFGGYWAYASNAGAFLLYVNHAFSFSATSVGCRLMYLHKETA